MANTYTQIFIQAVFAVKGRDNFIVKTWRDSLHDILLEFFARKLLAIGGWKDHVHIFFGLPPTLCLSELVQKVKANSSRWITQQKFVRGKFQWQACLPKG